MFIQFLTRPKEMFIKKLLCRFRLGLDLDHTVTTETHIRPDRFRHPLERIQQGDVVGGEFRHNGICVTLLRGKDGEQHGFS